MPDEIAVIHSQIERLEQQAAASKVLKIPSLIGAVGILIWGYFAGQVGISIALAIFLALFAVLVGTTNLKLAEELRQLKTNKKIRVTAKLHIGRLWWLTIESFANEHERRPLPAILYIDAQWSTRELMGYFSNDTLPYLEDHRVQVSELVAPSDSTELKEKECEIVFDDAGERVLAAFLPVGMVRIVGTSKLKYMG